MGKGEIARHEQFLLFPKCFQKACLPGASKGVIVWEWVKAESLQGKSGSEILTALQDLNCSFGFSTICRWVQKFKSGRCKLFLEHNSGRPGSATDGINTETVAQIFNFYLA